MNGFIPDKPEPPKLTVPYYERNLENKEVPGRGVEKPVEFYQKQIITLMAKLGAALVHFDQGTFPTEPKRYGYIISFSVNGIPGRIECAALPLISETAYKKDRALAQALFLVRTWLEAEVYSTVYRPGAIPLLPFLIGEGDKTVTEAIMERQQLITPIPSGYLPSGN